MLGSARQLRLAAVAFALGSAVELQDDADVVGQHHDLDPAAKAAQAQCDYRLAQFGRGGDYPCRSSTVTLISNRSSGIGYPRASCLGPKPWTDAMGFETKAPPPRRRAA
jgi:hypothetical protein